MKNVKMSVLAGLLLASVTLHANANLLANPGFEDPITQDGQPGVGYWEGFRSSGFSGAANDGSMPYAGNSALGLVIGNVADNFAGVSQDLIVLAGEVLDLTFWHKAVIASPNIEVRLEFRDSVNDTEVSRTPNALPTPGSDYEQFQLSSSLSLADRTIPVGADTARVVYAIASFGTAAANQRVLADEFKLFKVPAPGTIILLVTGLFAFGSMRRPVMKSYG